MKRRGIYVSAFILMALFVGTLAIFVVAPGITINDPTCVNKTYPCFFDDLAKLGR